MKALIKEIIGKEQRLISYASPEDPLLKRLFINSIELSTGRSKLEKAYECLKALNIENESIWNHVFPLLGITLNYNLDKLKTIPSDGPLVVIANHPYGVADGMALGFLLSQIRDDFKLIVNEVLCREEVLGKYFLPIDFRETKESIQTNIETRKSALSLLSDEGAIAIFPSGGVSTTPKLLSRTAVDFEWKKFLNKLVLRTKAHVLPVYFHGQNSTAFQVASHIHPNIRLALLLKQLDRKRGKAIDFVIGDVISPDAMSHLSRHELLPFLREATLDLQYL